MLLPSRVVKPSVALPEITQLERFVALGDCQSARLSNRVAIMLPTDPNIFYLIKSKYYCYFCSLILALPHAAQQVLLPLVPLYGGLVVLHDEL